MSVSEGGTERLRGDVPEWVAGSLRGYLLGKLGDLRHIQPEVFNPSALSNADRTKEITTAGLLTLGRMRGLLESMFCLCNSAAPLVDLLVLGRPAVETYFSLSWIEDDVPDSERRSGRFYLWAQAVRVQRYRHTFENTARWQGTDTQEGNRRVLDRLEVEFLKDVQALCNRYPAEKQDLLLKQFRRFHWADGMSPGALVKHCVRAAQDRYTEEAHLMRYMWLETSNACHGFGSSAADALQFSAAQECPMQRRQLHELDPLLSHMPLVMAICFVKVGVAMGLPEETTRQTLFAALGRNDGRSRPDAAGDG